MQLAQKRDNCLKSALTLTHTHTYIDTNSHTDMQVQRFISLTRRSECSNFSLTRPRFMRVHYPNSNEALTSITTMKRIAILIRVRIYLTYGQGVNRLAWNARNNRKDSLTKHKYYQH